MKSKPKTEPRSGSTHLLPAASPTLPAARCPRCNHGKFLTNPYWSYCKSCGHFSKGTDKPTRSGGAAGNTTVEARLEAVASDECSPMTNNQKPTE